MNDIDCLESHMEVFDVPVFIVGSDKKIKYKNTAAKKMRILIRTGSNLKNYLCASDMIQLSKLDTSEPVPVTLTADRPYNCTIQKAGSEYIIKILGLTAFSLYRISKFSEYAERKIQSCSTMIDTLIKSGTKANIIPEIAKKLSCIVKFQSKMTEYISLCGNTYKDSMVTQSALSSVRMVSDVISAFLPDYRIELESDDSINASCNNICINKTDFYSLITYLISFGVRYLTGRCLKLKTSYFENNVIFSVEGETIMPEEAVTAVCDFDPDRRFPAEFEDLLFSVAVSKALADHYGWRFDIITPGIGFSRIKALIAIPVSDAIPPFTLHSPKDISLVTAIVEKEFSDIDI